MLGKIEGRRRRGQQRMRWLDSITDLIEFEQTPGDRGFPGAPQGVLVVKDPPANAGDIRDAGLILKLGRTWRRKWQPTPVFLPGKFHEQRSLGGYSPWDP